MAQVVLNVLAAFWYIELHALTLFSYLYVRHWQISLVLLTDYREHKNSASLKVIVPCS